MRSNITLIPTVNSTSGPVYSSSRDKGAGYYKSTNPLHSVSYTVIAGFSGTIAMYGTLVSDPAETDWVLIPETVFTETLATENTNIFKGFKGQYVWVKAVVTNFTAGSIEKVSYSFNQ